MNAYFEYSYFRQLISEAFQTSEFSVIAPYGFELLDTLAPFWPRRHYIAVGYLENMSRIEAEDKLKGVISQLIDDFRLKYPEFFQRLVFVEIHRGQQWLLVEDLTEINRLSNTLHIDLFASKETILNHYARYILCLFGAIKEGNENLPEIREFSLSKTRRNRLFQEYVMCDALFRKMGVGTYEMTKKEVALTQELFEELKIQEISELIPVVQAPHIEVKCMEKKICSELIFPRVKKMSEILKNRASNQSRHLLSETYYDDGCDRLIEVKISEEDLYCSPLRDWTFLRSFLNC